MISRPCTSHWRTVLISVALMAFLVGAARGESWEQTDSTRLMFVGEDLSVLSIASKREERVREAPALASVITRSERVRYGYDTLGEAISSVPGFYVAHEDRSSRAYLRGVRDATLFLYDGIPFSNDSSNQSPPLDRELSLSWVKRIEIIRGPSSVLWGSDAFSGVVNVVPLEGKDLQGFELGASAGNPDLYEGFAQWGNTYQGWDAFISVNGSRSGNFRDRFRTRSDDPENPFLEGTIDNDHYVEVVARCSYEDLITISGRFSDFKDYYTLKTQAGRTEPSVRSSPFSMFKLDMKQEVAGGDLRFHGFLNHFDLDEEEGTDKLYQDNISYHLELLYDRSFWKNGLLTVGASHRRNEASEEFVSEDPFQGRKSVKIDYSSNLNSLFGQLRQRWGDFDFWVGGRFDSHSEYDDNVSFRTGSTWFATDMLSFKLLLGTAFRTPANIQATRTKDLKAEEIKSIELAAYWSINDQTEIRASIFHDRLSDLIQQNSEGEVSNRDTEKINGVELELNYRPFSALSMYANATYLDSAGDPVELEGLREDRYDLGASTMINAGAYWNIFGPLNSSIRLQYLGDREVARIVQGTDERPEADRVLLVHLNLYVKDFLREGLVAGIKVDNLLDKDYKEPGNFDLIEGDPLTWRLYLSYRF